MSDCGDIIDYFEESKKAWENKNILDAAVYSFWCIQYCEYGEPYGMSSAELKDISSDAYKIFSKAHKKIKSIPLSKTTFVYGSICPKLLWLYKNKYDQRRISETTQKNFDRGHAIGDLAQKLFPSDLDASKYGMEFVIDMQKISLPFNLKQNVWLNNTLSMYKNRTLYEAAFAFDDVFAAVDILEKSSSGHIAYEVKSSTSITDTYVLDSALQYYVISKTCKLDDFYLVYLNKPYIEEMDIPYDAISESNVDINRLFIKESVLSRILPMQDEIKKKINACKSVLMGKEPDICMGRQCQDPYECMFTAYCRGGSS